MMSEKMFLEGALSVESALQAESRDVFAIYLQRGKWNPGIRRIHELAQTKAIPVEQVPRQFIDEQANGQTHGGVLAQVGPRRFQQLPDLLDGVTNPFLVMLDGIEDPYNFGQAIRALYASGVHGVVVSQRNWLTAAAIVARASAGASEKMPMAMVEFVTGAADFYRQEGLVVACTTKEKATSLYATDLTKPTFLLIGGEKRGITRSFLATTDVRIKIPYGRFFEQSLGATAATAVIAFEMMRQRSKK